MLALIALFPLVASVPPTSQTAHGSGEPPKQAPTTPADPNCKIKPVDGLAKETIAVYPLLDDPVAFCIDERGNFYFAESDRQDLGIEDNRHSAYWLLDDIQLVPEPASLVLFGTGFAATASCSQWPGTTPPSVVSPPSDLKTMPPASMVSSRLVLRMSRST